jgi:ADP-ribose pyrophosphatase
MRKIVPDTAILIPKKAQRAFKGVIYEVYQWEQENFDDSVTTFEMLKRPDTVSVMAIVDDKMLVLNDEQPHRGLRLSFPGGRVDEEDESTLAAAKRETLEETGYEFGKWKLLDVFQPQAKLEWFIYVYVAWDVTNKSATHHDPGEKITQELKTFKELQKLARQGVGYMGEARAVLEKLHGFAELKALPEFKGKEVDR